MANNVETADKWTEKVNAKDVEAVLELSDHNIELIGAGGSASAGHDTLAEWVRNSDMHLTTQSHYAKGDCVICEQEATWKHDRGNAILYTLMIIREGKVHRIARFDGLDEAFGFCSLSEEDKVD